MKLKIQEKTGKDLWEDVDWLGNLATMVVIYSLLWLITIIPFERFKEIGLIVYNAFLKVGLESTGTWKFLFYITLIAFAIYAIKFAFDLLVKLWSKIKK